MTPENARYVAQRIPGAELVELHRNRAQLPWYDGAEEIVSEVGRFISGIQEHQATFDRLLATVLFTDVVDSTSQAAAMGDRAWREVQERHDALVRSNLTQFRGREIKTLGDGFLATFDGPARAVRCASAIRDTVRSLNLEVRCGLHTGECEIVGNDIAGIAVHTGARVAALAAPGEVLVSQTVRDLVAGSGLILEEYGTYTLKGVPNEWRLFRAAD
jgi:class 3 adenylate cyclase